jgi:hypothetical protein
MFCWVVVMDKRIEYFYKVAYCPLLWNRVNEEIFGQKVLKYVLYKEICVFIDFFRQVLQD